MEKSSKIHKIRWPVLIFLLVFHLGALLAPLYYTKEALTLFIVLWVVTGMFGITVGYHRLLTHKSFETNDVISFILALCGCLAFQQGPLSWVRLHRAHHTFSDTEKDPHPQYLGFLFGHMLWPFVSIKGVGESQHRRTTPPDLASKGYFVLLEKYNLHIGILSLVLLYVWGGLPFLIWGGFLRIVVVMHITWSVNSIGHRFGYRRYETKDSSRNNWMVALLAFGEGWHNNHHRYPNSARMGLSPLEVDFSWYLIRTLSLFGLAWNIKVKSDPGI